MRPALIVFMVAFAACSNGERIVLPPTTQLAVTARATAQGRVVSASGEGIAGAFVLIDVPSSSDPRGAYIGAAGNADSTGRFSRTLERVSATRAGVDVDTVRATVVWYPQVPNTPGQIDTILIRFSPTGVSPTPTTHELRWRGGQRSGG